MKPRTPDNSEEVYYAKLCAYVEGELGPEDRAEIEKHLETHAQHRKILAELTETRAMLQGLPRESAPFELAEAFEGQLERSSLLDFENEIKPQSRGAVSWTKYFAAAAVVFLAVGLGAVVFMAMPKRTGNELAINASPSPARSESSTTTAPSADMESRSQKFALTETEESAPGSAFKATTPPAPLDEKGEGAGATPLAGLDMATTQPADPITQPVAPARPVVVVLSTPDPELTSAAVSQYFAEIKAKTTTLEKGELSRFVRDMQTPAAVQAPAAGIAANVNQKVPSRIDGLTPPASMQTSASELARNSDSTRSPFEQRPEVVHEQTSITAVPGPDSVGEAEKPGLESLKKRFASSGGEVIESLDGADVVIFAGNMKRHEAKALSEALNVRGVSQKQVAMMEGTAPTTQPSQQAGREDSVALADPQQLQPTEPARQRVGEAAPETPAEIEDAQPTEQITIRQGQPPEARILKSDARASGAPQPDENDRATDQSKGLVDAPTTQPAPPPAFQLQQQATTAPADWNEPVEVVVVLKREASPELTLAQKEVGELKDKQDLQNETAIAKKTAKDPVLSPPPPAPVTVDEPAAKPLTEEKTPARAEKPSGEEPVAGTEPFAADEPITLVIVDGFGPGKDRTLELRIEPDGTLQIPDIGTVTAAGRTPPELAIDIARAFGALGEKRPAGRRVIVRRPVADEPAAESEKSDLQKKP